MSFVLFLISHWKKNIWEVLPPNIHPPTHMILCLCAIFLTSKRRRVLSGGLNSRASPMMNMPNKLSCTLQCICPTTFLHVTMHTCRTNFSALYNSYAGPLTPHLLVFTTLSLACVVMLALVVDSGSWS